MLDTAKGNRQDSARQESAAISDRDLHHSSPRLTTQQNGLLDHAEISQPIAKGDRTNPTGSDYSSKESLQSSSGLASAERSPNESAANTSVQIIDCTNPDELLRYIQEGRVLAVNKRRRNGLVLYKQFHAEFAGPGAAVGGVFDADCKKVIPVGNLSLVAPETHEERQEAYLIRRQWIRLTQQFTDTSEAIQRAKKILNQFETYFDAPTIARIPDESFALMVGVMPNTVRLARRPPAGKVSVKVRG
ncbi:MULTISPECIES: hypothetical protein [Thermoleptolyngbya]|uniref:hypothetical protein n=1 Tax=Thermoleptolyngbya TaxID=2303528 RepID=UPI001E34022F|nr:MULTISPECIES: hypothetical protein [Thermoleptolyngbya]